MYNKKGQAAMEFLMTYGWAILAAIIAIGVLAYFGVFSPGKYAPSAMVISQPFYAQGAVADSASQIVSIEIKNNGGEDVVITNMSILNTGDVVCTTNGSTIPSSDEISPLYIPVGKVNISTIECTGMTADKPLKGDVDFRYTKYGSELSLTASGSITQTVV